MKKEDDNKKEDLLDSFLSKSMKEEDKTAFESLLKEDEEFAKHVAFSMALDAQIKKQAITDRLKTMEHKRKTGRQLLAVVVSVLLLLAAVFAYRYFSGKRQLITPEESNKAIAAVRERDSDYFELLGGQTDWRYEMSQNHYSKALDMLKNDLAPKNDCEDIDERYFAGILYLYLERDYANAVTQLQCALHDNRNQPFRNDVPRHLVVALIGEGDYSQAKKVYQNYGLKATDFPKSIRPLLDK